MYSWQTVLAVRLLHELHQRFGVEVGAWRGAIREFRESIDGRPFPGLWRAFAQFSDHNHALLTAFKAKTGCPVLVNTSFNVRGEPIVCLPEDAFRCFMGTDIERLAIGNCYLRKENQRADLMRDYRDAFDPD